MLLNCGVEEDSWESLELQGDPTSPSQRKSILNIHWKDWCWRWNSNTLATWCEEITHLKRPWCWERLKVRGERDDRGWDAWMASLSRWTLVWASSRSWWWTRKPTMLQFMGSQRVRHDWKTEPNWIFMWWVTSLFQDSLSVFDFWNFYYNMSQYLYLWVHLTWSSLRLLNVYLHISPNLGNFQPLFLKILFF